MIYLTLFFTFFKIDAAIISVAQKVFFPGGFALDVFKHPQIYISLILTIIMIICAFKKVHPIIIILLSAVVGILVGYIFPELI